MYNALALAYQGRKEEATKAFESVVVIRKNYEVDEMPTNTDVLFLKASIILAYREGDQELLKYFTGTGTYVSGTECPTSISRHLGGVAALKRSY